MTKDTPTPRLLPCPFCGTEPVTMKHEGYSSVYCPNEACYVEPACVSRDCNVADRWNTRQTADDLEARPTREELAFTLWRADTTGGDLPDNENTRRLWSEGALFRDDYYKMADAIIAAGVKVRG
jgi:hypothetical protein